MLFLNLPVSTANTVYQVSFIALFIGAAVVILSAIALVWSGAIRQNDLTERLSHLETTRAQANDEAAMARAKLDDATQQLAQAHADAAQARKDAEAARQATITTPIVTGRQITAENCGLFINFVRTVLKGRIILEAVSSNPEAMQFARQLSDMLKSAGYDIEEKYGSPTLLGDQPVGVQMKIRSMEEQPSYAGSLQRGLEFIGIDTSGALDSSAADTVIIYVGTKP